MPLQVAVCGPSDATAEELGQAAEVGRLLAQRGAVVVCGGYGGVMGAVAQGAARAGGIVVGILSGRDRTGANPHLSVALPTGMSEARNNLVAQAGDALIAVGGSWGTLSEVALAVRRGTSRVVSLGGWRVLDAHGDQVPGIRYAPTPHAAVAAALD
ncbi:TIGR00725 family protein [Actinospica sp.]|uniref:TIGR00725 family protein n=1 Tax=Actinospica sp. TaxID=1872142 RepID=UPI002CDA211A|nr:TIGR00725 family protein [Actinospica sp.]HWG24660.1 TIGR00725 family protein [Actinospica sp.]